MVSRVSPRFDTTSHSKSNNTEDINLGQPQELRGSGHTWRLARPSSHLLTRDANLSEHSDSPAELTAGEMLESISVLQLPPSDDWRRSALPNEREVSGWDAGWLVSHAWPDVVAVRTLRRGGMVVGFGVQVSLELRKGTCP